MVERLYVGTVQQVITVQMSISLQLLVNLVTHQSSTRFSVMNAQLAIFVRLLVVILFLVHLVLINLLQVKPIVTIVHQAITAHH